MNIKQLNSGDDTFWTQLDELLAWDSVSDEQVFSTVNEILKNVRKRGDEAVVEYTINLIVLMSVTCQSWKFLLQVLKKL